MPAKEPGWWYRGDDAPAGWLLQPVAAIWAAATMRRIRRANAYRCALPVVCVGNFTAGGSGKTPLSIAIARRLQAAGERPVFLTRGYGGRRAGPHRVEVGRDTAVEVGDEPLLLARAAPVVVARDRAAGARFIETWSGGEARPSVIVMDDGLQNPFLAKDISIAVIDGRRGLGNRRVIPAGPLRAPLGFQLGLADAIVVTRPGGAAEDGEALVAELAAVAEGALLRATVEPFGDWSTLAGKRVLAVSGIAGPQRFVSLLRRLGAQVAEAIAYPDHHTLREAEAQHVLERAAALDASILTTEKDLVRMSGAGGAVAMLAAQAVALPIAVVFTPEDGPRLDDLLARAVTARRGC